MGRGSGESRLSLPLQVPPADDARRHATALDALVRDLGLDRPSDVVTAATRYALIPGYIDPGAAGDALVLEAPQLVCDIEQVAAYVLGLRRVAGRECLVYDLAPTEGDQTYSDLEPTIDAERTRGAYPVVPLDPAGLVDRMRALVQADARLRLTDEERRYVLVFAYPSGDRWLATYDDEAAALADVDGGHGAGGYLVAFYDLYESPHPRPDPLRLRVRLLVDGVDYEVRER